MRPELILWDWNGTLLDDVELCVDALNRLLEKHAYPQRYDRDQYRAIFGFPIEEYYVRAGFDFSRHSFAMLAEEYMDDYIPASAACPQVILSASPVPTLTRQAGERHVTGYFDRLLGLGDIYAKSKVELGRRFMQEEGIDPARAVMIGDSVHDFEVAQAMGTACVLQCSGHQNRQTLAATGAPVVEDLREAAQLILG